MILTRGNVTFDTESGAIRAARSEHVSPAPAIILEAMLKKNGIVSRALMLDLVWNNRPDGPEAGVVPVYISRLRNTLARIGADISIRTFHCRGYGIQDGAVDGRSRVGYGRPKSSREEPSCPTPS